MLEEKEMGREEKSGSNAGKERKKINFRTAGKREAWKREKDKGKLQWREKQEGKFGGQ